MRSRLKGAAMLFGLLPLTFAFLWLLKGLWGNQPDAWFLPLLIPAMVVGPAVAWLASGPRLAHSRSVRALAIPCLLAPLAVTSAWAVVPSHLGVGYGGFEFFLRWLTKYPNLGPVNYEVLLGILCILGASSAPAFFALYRLRGGQGRAVLSGLLVLQFVAYVPVLVRLDWMMVVCSAQALIHGHSTLLGGGDAASILEKYAIASEGAGALYRLAATLSMVSMLALSLRDRVAKRLSAQQSATTP